MNLFFISTGSNVTHPLRILRNSAIDACAQCSEGYDSKSGNYYTKFLCKKALIIFKNKKSYR